MNITLNKYASTKKYHIYIVIHPKFEGWIKIGRTTNLENRLNQYQTGCPFRDYKLVYNKFVSDANIATAIEKYFKLTIHNNGYEWYKCSIEEAISIIENFKDL